MRTATKIAAAVAVGVVGTGVVAVPAVLAAGDSSAPGTSSVQPGPGNGPGWGMRGGPGTGGGFGRGGGFGMGGGVQGGAGAGGRYGAAAPDDCPMVDADAQGSLTDAQKRTLQGNAEEEKLAHDVYVQLAKSSGDLRFTRIATAETRHLAAVRELLDRYDVADPTKGLTEGEFKTQAVADDYQRLVHEGSASLADALRVGGQIERADIAALEKAQKGLDAPDVATMYAHLQRASQMHLRAFSAGVS